MTLGITWHYLSIPSPLEGPVLSINISYLSIVLFLMYAQGLMCF